MGRGFHGGSGGWGGGFASGIVNKEIWFGGKKKNKRLHG